MLRAFFKKFTDYHSSDEYYYVSASRVNEHYGMIARNPTQIDLVTAFKLDYKVVYSRGNKKKNILAGDAVSISTLTEFNPRIMKLMVRLDQLTDINRLNKLKLPMATIDQFKRLMNRIADAADINDDPIDIDGEDKLAADQDHSIDIDREDTHDTIELPLIELEEHEKFRDVNDEVFPIEVRGSRTKNGIYFKAKDVGKFFELEHFIKSILDKRFGYKYGADYILVKKDGDRESRIILAPEQDENSGRISHDNLFLTQAGLVKASTVSRSGNANMAKVFDWIVNLCYVHQFGSSSERSDMAQSLLKNILNDSISGLYAIDLGTFSDMYDTMNISRDTYPPEVYGNHHIYKFGLSKSISTRLTQHRNKTNGYGRWSNNISLKWIIILSEAQLFESEKILSKYFNDENLLFEYIDADNKAHNELIMVGPYDEPRVRSIYKKTLARFPTKENELVSLISSMQVEHECDIKLKDAKQQAELDKLKHEYDIKLAHKDTQLAKKDTELAMKDSEADIAHKDTQLAKKDTELAMKDIEILTLKLKILESSHSS